MKISRFIIITQPDDNKAIYLLYNTATTAFVALNAEDYQEIFEEKNFSKNQYSNALYKMGFLIDDNVDELNKMYEIRQKSSQGMITNITILTTTGCNARCAYCFEEGINRYNMTQATAEATVKYILDNFPNKQIGIGWFGGEPLLNISVIKYIIDRLHDNGYDVFSHVTTNGSLITDEFLSYAKNNSFKSFQITIDNVDDKYGEIKAYVDISKEKAFERTIHNVIKLLKNDFRTLVRINFAATQIEEAAKTFNKLYEILYPYNSNGNLYIYLAPLQLHTEGENICNLKYTGEHPYMTATKLQFKLGFPFNSYKSSIDPKEKILVGLNLYPTGYGCGMLLENRVVIDADGKLYKCHRLVGKKQYSCGDVFSGIEKNAIYQKYVNMEIEDDECNNCNILPLCQGGCKSNAFLYGHEYRCVRIKQVKEELIKYYYVLLNEKTCARDI